MPVTNAQQAFDEAANAIRTAWEADPLSSSLVLGYEGVTRRPPSGGTGTRPTAWAWVSYAEAEGRQATFGRAPNRRFESMGPITVQIFAPGTDGLQNARNLATIVQEALEDMKTAGGVIADSVRQVPVGQDGTWYQMNVVGDLKYERCR